MAKEVVPEGILTAKFERNLHSLEGDHSLLNIDHTNLTFKKRSGTTNEGKTFELFFLLKLLLDLITNSKVKNFEVAADHSEFGAMDDVIYDITSPHEDTSGKHAVQLKYSNGNKILSLQQLEAPEGDFSLLKYFKDYQKLYKTFGKFKFFLVTNRKFDDRNQHLKFENQISIELKVTKMQSQNWVQFQIVDAGDVNKDSLEDYQRFFKNLTIVTDYSSVGKIKEDAKKMFSDNFCCTDEHVFKKYVEFVENWSNKKGIKIKLHSAMIRHVVALLILSPSMECLSFQSKIVNERTEVFRRAISQFDVTLLSEENSHQVIALWSDVKSDLEEVTLIRAKHYQILRPCVQSFQELNDEEWSKLLWLMGKCPLVVRDSEATRKAIGLCDARKFVVLYKEVVPKFPFPVFHRLADLRNNISYGEVLATFNCSLQGKKPISLKQLMDKKEKLSDVITTDQLVLMLNEPLVFGGHLEHLPETHISRYVSRNILSHSALTDIDLEKTQIIVSCVDDLEPFCVETKWIDELSGCLEEFQKEHFVIVTPNNFSTKEFVNLSTKVPKNCCHFRSTPAGLEWVQNTTNIEETKLLVETAFVPELQLLSYEDDNNVNILCANPGMGKTTLVKTLKNNTDPTSWSVLISAKDHSRHFCDNIDAFKSYLFSMNDAKIVEVLATEGRVRYFWDGLDELLPQNFEKILTTISKWSEKEESKHWVTSRTNMRQRLESHFNVVAKTIKEFDGEDQMLYLKKRLKCEDSELVEIFEKINRNIQLCPRNDVMAIPLQIYILSELFVNNKEKYKELLDRMFSIADLYEYFVEERFNLHFKRPVNIEQCHCDGMQKLFDMTKKNQIDFYKRTSMKLHFEEVPVEDVAHQEDVVGFLVSNNEFSHTSFGEYFAALYLSEHQQIVTKIPDFIFNEQYNNIRFFFDLIVAKKSRVHIAVLYKNVGILATCNDEEFSAKDLIGRTALEVACSWCDNYPYLDITQTKNLCIVETQSFLRTKGQVSTVSVNKSVLEFLMTKYQLEDVVATLSDESLFFGSVSLKVLPLAMLTNKTKLRTKMFNQHVFVVLQHCIILDYNDLVDICDEIWMMKNECGYPVQLQLIQLHSINILRKILATKRDVFSGPNCFPLHWACLNHDHEIVELLLENNVDVNSLNSSRHTAIHYASSQGNYRITKLLLENGAKPAFQHASCKLSIGRFCKKRNYEMVELLIQYGSPVNFQDSSGKTPLYHTCVNGHYKLSKLLIEKGADIFVEDPKGRTPLYEAFYYKHHDIAELLMENGARLDTFNRGGKTLIHLACELKHYHLVAFLLEKQTKAVVDYCDEAGRTCVHYACQGENCHILNLLVANGASLEVADQEGRTPLHYACEKGRLEAVKILVERGVEVDCRDVGGNTPVDLARKKSFFQIVNLLKETY